MNVFKKAKRKYRFVTLSYWVKRPPMNSWQQFNYRLRNAGGHTSRELLIGLKTNTLVVSSVEVTA